MEPRYPFVAVDVRSDRSDEIGAALFELGAQGLEERDDGTLVRGAGAGNVTLVASFVDHAAAEEAMAALRELEPELSPRLEEVVGDAWRDAWKEHFSPFALTPDITIAPPWVEAPAAKPGERVLVLEPGRAFGTGLHATTALVAEVLHEHKARLAGREVLDLGTGSGILALVALVYGSGPVLAVDNDADVIEVVRENAERNGLGAQVTARAGTLATVKQKFPWVLANIEARVLLPLADELARAVEPGGMLVLSGILAPEEERVRERYLGTGAGLVHEGTKRRGSGEEGWVAIAFSRGS
jgi:ribosomal protein L11 methyltransferase